jgi:hypothetical protein
MTPRTSFGGISGYELGHVPDRGVWTTQTDAHGLHFESYAYGSHVGKLARPSAFCKHAELAGCDHARGRAAPEDSAMAFLFTRTAAADR